MASHNWITNNVPGNPRNGQQYYVDNSPDSHGNPGKWHIYKDGTKEFLADNKATPNGGTPYTPPAPVAATPAAPNGGTTAPNEPPPSTATPPVTGIPAPPKAPEDTSLPHLYSDANQGLDHFYTGDPQSIRDYVEKNPNGVPLLTNDTKGGPHSGDKYIANPGYDSNNNLGLFHLYQDGTFEFIDKHQGSLDKPFYQTNNDPSSPHYNEKYLTITKEGKDGNIYDVHRYTDDNGKLEEEWIPVSNSSRSATKSSTDSPTDSSASATASGTTASTTTTSSNRTREGQSKTSGTQHTVVAGDTLSGIAAANGIPLADLEALNPQIDNPNLIHPGEQINLGDSRDAPASAENSDTVLPTTSTYASSDATNQHQLDDGTVEKISGWVGAASEVADDPVKGIIDTVANHIQTDPTKIDDNKHNN
jgi:LysM repeat protein